MLNSKGKHVLGGFMIGLKKFKSMLSTKVMLLTFSLVPLAEQSHLPCADTVAHSTATQAQKGTICAGKQLQNKKQLLPPRFYF